jgi:uncharacterized damage-inducible protein DinB
MNTHDFVSTLFQHNLWANVKLFTLCATLSEAQLASKVNGAYGSIRETLQHLAQSEASYLSRITTGQRLAETPDAPPPTLPELLASVQRTGAAYIAAAPTVTPQAGVSVDWDGTPRAVPLVILLTQAINHATEHREQIMAMLTQLGVETPELDAWAYFDERTR